MQFIDGDLTWSIVFDAGVCLYIFGVNFLIIKI